MILRGDSGRFFSVRNQSVRARATRCAVFSLMPRAASSAHASPSPLQRGRQRRGRFVGVPAHAHHPVRLPCETAVELAQMARPASASGSSTKAFSRGPRWRSSWRPATYGRLFDRPCHGARVRGDCGSHQWKSTANRNVRPLRNRRIVTIDRGYADVPETCTSAPFNSEGSVVFWAVVALAARSAPAAAAASSLES